MTDVLLVLNTCPDAACAAFIARTLVSEGLAACVNRVPGVMSTYRWQGAVHDDAEVLLLIKTTAQRLEALRARLLELHPYDVPELIALPIERGHAAYLAWLREAVTP
jgi:periplasmic divalent cation tolerance protein